MNPSSQEVVVKANLYGTNGIAFGTRDVTFVVPPKSMKQLPLSDLFGGVFMTDGYVKFEATVPVFTWGSVIDNRSGDPIFIRGVEDKAEVRPLWTSPES